MIRVPLFFTNDDETMMKEILTKFYMYKKNATSLTFVFSGKVKPSRLFFGEKKERKGCHEVTESAQKSPVRTSL